MTQTEAHRFEPRAYLMMALAATLGVVVLPGAVTYSALAVIEPDPPLMLTSLATLLLSLFASAVGSRAWLHHHRSAELSFGDLMLWQWWKRSRADGCLDDGARLLADLEDGVTARSREAQLRDLRRVAAALEAKDPYTLGHSKRVRMHAYRTAVAMRLPLQELEDLRLAAELHDVGKMMLSDRIIRKEGPLDDTEWASMKRHPAVGAQMVEGLGNPRVVAAIRSHHERWDGAGYPDGLAGEEIPLLARVIAVADTFDAITSTRSYRRKSTYERALQVIEEEAGKQLDPRVVKAFLQQAPRRSAMASMAASLLPGVANVFRELALVAKRVGVASLAGGVGAASASLAITASTFKPPSIQKFFGPRPAAAAEQEQGGSRDERRDERKREPAAAPQVATSYSSPDGSATAPLDGDRERRVRRERRSEDSGPRESDDNDRPGRGDEKAPASAAVADDDKDRGSAPDVPPGQTAGGGPEGEKAQGQGSEPKEDEDTNPGGKGKGRS